MNQHHAELTDVWLLPVAAETWDGYLNDINGHHVNEDTVIEALQAATAGQPDEGSVGGGTGMNCYQFKGGNGTASRLVEYNETTYTVGVFLQANFGRRSDLTLAGVYLGEELADDNPMRDFYAAPSPPTRRSSPASASPSPGGSPSAWPVPARSAATPRATSSSPSPPPTKAPSPGSPRSPRRPRRPRRTRRTASATATSSSSRGMPSTRSTRPSSRPPKRPSPTR
jgi:hypothetical protein